MSNNDVSRSGGPVERDVEQAITALKKGAYLLKYGRRGKPKFCPFRLANDESVLIWFSGKEEKRLKLVHVSRIISGQRTPIFQRYPRPEKEYQSFSLIYNERSLDLICKDKEEAEAWFSGLKALISRGHQRKWKTESRSDGVSSGANSPRTYTRRSSPLHSPFGCADGLQKVASLSSKAQFQEVELERTTKQLKEAIAIAGEEAAKCKAAKEVIKSLTAQLKDMAERLPLGSARNTKSPTFASLGSPLSIDVSNVYVDQFNCQINGQAQEFNESNNLLSNWSSTASNRSLGTIRQHHTEAMMRNGNKTKESDTHSENEWVEQDEPGVYITLTSLPGGLKDLKRVRFSRKRFSEKQAEQWWAENRTRVYELYNVRVVDKSSIGIGIEDLAH